jgi:hypothetical protein
MGGGTVNEWGTNKRMETADRRRQTAVYGTGFPARQRMDGTTVNGGITAQSFRPAGGYCQRRGERHSFTQLTTWPEKWINDRLIKNKLIFTNRCIIRGQCPQTMTLSLVFYGHRLF